MGVSDYKRRYSIYVLINVIEEVKSYLWLRLTTLSTLITITNREPERSLPFKRKPNPSFKVLDLNVRYVLLLCTVLPSEKEKLLWVFCLFSRHWE